MENVGDYSTTLSFMMATWLSTTVSICQSCSLWKWGIPDENTMNGSYMLESRHSQVGEVNQQATLKSELHYVAPERGGVRQTIKMKKISSIFTQWQTFKGKKPITSLLLLH
ncbi:hypothetical protein M9H77_17102 [Catharanthus roseus]|uniref:Uncharacterized protein n=1 Tax=Catharanthus roseus TaxID=4058 RepID=A0ACC0B3N4_CATRO|nr:hypothetical protein M9H77_17102 [Catharanthus roseus]